MRDHFILAYVTVDRFIQYSLDPSIGVILGSCAVTKEGAVEPHLQLITASF